MEYGIDVGSKQHAPGPICSGMAGDDVMDLIDRDVWRPVSPEVVSNEQSSLGLVTSWSWRTRNGAGEFEGLFAVCVGD
jgi:hypothetical protein